MQGASAGLALGLSSEGRGLLPYFVIEAQQSVGWPGPAVPVAPPANPVNSEQPPPTRAVDFFSIVVRTEQS
jgi:hypothetical protein